jgi:hypothetical protein
LHAGPLTPFCTSGLKRPWASKGLPLTPFCFSCVEVVAKFLLNLFSTSGQFGGWRK